MCFESQGAIIAAKYDGGILISADKKVPYGHTLEKPDFHTHFEFLYGPATMGVSGPADDFVEILLEICDALRNESNPMRWDKRPFPEIYTAIKGYMAKRQSDRKPPSVKVVIAGINSDKTTFLGAIDLDGTSWEGDVLCTDPERINVDKLKQVVGRSRDEVLKAMKRVWLDLKVVHRIARGDVELDDVGRELSDRYLPIPGVNREYLHKYGV